MATLKERRDLAYNVLGQIEFMLAKGDAVQGYRDTYAFRNPTFLTDSHADFEAKRANSDKVAEGIFNADYDRLVTLLNALANLPGNNAIEKRGEWAIEGIEKSTKRPRGMKCSNCGDDNWVEGPRSLDFYNFGCVSCMRSTSRLTETGMSR